MIIKKNPQLMFKKERRKSKGTYQMKDSI